MKTMKIMVEISEQDYVYIAKKHCLPSCDDKTLRKTFYEMILKGTPLDEIKDEIEQIKINDDIRDVECFRAGINAALNVINKYNSESEE